MTIWNRLQIARIFLQLLFNPYRTELVFKGVDILLKERNMDAMEAIEQKALADDGFRALYAENYLPENPRLEDLARMPAASFGAAVYRHLNDNKISLDLFPRGNPGRPMDYLNARIYRDHDLWHVLLGYGITIEDEIALQAFSIAQFRSIVGTLLVAGGLLRLLWQNPAKAVEAFERVNEAYALGKRARFLLGVRLHELLPEPLAEVRAMLFDPALTLPASSKAPASLQPA